MDWYEKDARDLLAELGSDDEYGLKSSTVRDRLQHYGHNQFDEQKEESIFSKILHTLRDATIIILIVAAILSLIMTFQGDKGLIEFFVILGIIVLNVTLSVTQERNAERALDKLKKLSSPKSFVYRDGKKQEVNSADLVPGDVLVLTTGDLISADARIIESTDFAVDESILTGESEPVEKDAKAELTGKIPVGDQVNMVFSGCLVTAGRAKALVVATGMHTQMGHIAGFLNNSQKLRTPLQKRLDGVGKTISFIAIAAAAVVVFVELYRGADFWDVAFVAIALAVAAVPETLALIVTLILTNGVTEMVKKNALIRKLVAVETLGSTSVICTDKTGTLTLNRMSVQRLWIPDSEAIDDSANFTDDQLDLLEKLALCSNAVEEEDKNGKAKIIGDPTESAILRLLSSKNESKSALEKVFPRIAEIAFSSERKMMTTIHEDPDGGYLVLTKGAFDRVPFKKSAEKQATCQKMHDAFAHDALRVIALASKHVTKLPPDDKLTDLEENMHFEGIIGIIDPPRPEAAEAIKTAFNAGILTVMITGDHAITAEAIAKQVGLLTHGEKVMTGLELESISDEELCRTVPQYTVYARVSPEDKIRIVEAWQEHNEVVAMTGDGVNDAPALKAADVGVAMGITGTEVSKSAADMVLTDDNFSTIVAAIHKGRGVYANIRKTIYYLLSTNFSEIILMLSAQLMGWGLPLTPIMILLINVIGVGVPGLFMAREKPDPNIMQRNPVKRGESLFEGLLFNISRQTTAFVFAALVGYYIGAFVIISNSIGPAYAVGQTMAFLIIGWSAILHIFTARSEESITKSNVLHANPWMLAGAGVMILTFAILVLVPGLGESLGMATLSITHWLIVVGLVTIPTIAAEIGKYISRRSEAKEYKNRLVKHITSR